MVILVAFMFAVVTDLRSNVPTPPVLVTVKSAAPILAAAVIDVLSVASRSIVTPALGVTASKSAAGVSATSVMIASPVPFTVRPFACSAVNVTVTSLPVAMLVTAISAAGETAVTSSVAAPPVLTTDNVVAPRFAADVSVALVASRSIARPPVTVTFARSASCLRSRSVISTAPAPEMVSPLARFAVILRVDPVRISSSVAAAPVSSSKRISDSVVANSDTSMVFAPSRTNLVPSLASVAICTAPVPVRIKPLAWVVFNSSVTFPLRPNSVASNGFVDRLSTLRVCAPVEVTLYARAAKLKPSTNVVVPASPRSSVTVPVLVTLEISAADASRVWITTEPAPVTVSVVACAAVSFRVVSDETEISPSTVNTPPLPEAIADTSSW